MSYTAPLLLSQTAADLHDGKIDLQDFINTICDRIDVVDPVIHALLPEPGRRERLLKEAEELQKKYPDIHNRPVLFGIPVGVKDLFRVDGFPTKAGSLLPERLFEGKESSVITRLKEAGALILGKTVTTEFAYFEPGPTCNPYEVTHTPGGSSSGSAAAVACGFVPLALGTQTIGSVTRPAAFCGVNGFKPSFGRIATDGIIPFSESADHVGFFSQDLSGIEMVAGILCRQWKTEANLADRNPVIGVVTGKYLEQSDDEVRRFFESAVLQFEQAGFKVIRIDALGDIETINKTHRSMIAADFAGVHNNWFHQYENLYRKTTKELILKGRLVTPEMLENARQGRNVLRANFEMISTMNQIDLWLSPSSCTEAPEGLSSTGSPLMNLPWTYMGLPTVSVPSGTTAAGLPLGLQFAGSFMKDELMLAWIKKLIHLNQVNYQ